MRAFADALESIPIALAENCGLPPIGGWKKCIVQKRNTGECRVQYIETLSCCSSVGLVCPRFRPQLAHKTKWAAVGRECLPVFYS
jgi:hypothetical protein